MKTFSLMAAARAFGLASMMMIGLLAMAAIAVIGLIMRRRATLPPPAMSGEGRIPYGPVDYLSAGSSSPSRDAAASVSTRNVPHDFDVAGFERPAKVSILSRHGEVSIPMSSRLTPP